MASEFQARSQNSEKRLLVLSCLSIILPSVHMEEFGSHLTDIHESLILEYVSKIYYESPTLIKTGQQ
jgi:hypothetical protein